MDDINRNIRIDLIHFINMTNKSKYFGPYYDIKLFEDCLTGKYGEENLKLAKNILYDYNSKFNL